MNEIILGLIAIVPSIISARITYVLATKKLQNESEGRVKSEFNKLSEKLRLELKIELDECRKDRENLRKELNDYKKELEIYKKENETLKKEMGELETKLESANEVINTLVTKKTVKIK
jgi:uncharacterized protein YlxW (UPF0749 family)